MICLLIPVFFWRLSFYFDSLYFSFYFFSFLLIVSFHFIVWYNCYPLHFLFLLYFSFHSFTNSPFSINVPLLSQTILSLFFFHFCPILFLSFLPHALPVIISFHFCPILFLSFLPHALPIMFSFHFCPKLFLPFYLMLLLSLFPFISAPNCSFLSTSYSSYHYLLSFLPQTVPSFLPYTLPIIIFFHFNPILFLSFCFFLAYCSPVLFL